MRVLVVIWNVLAALLASALAAGAVAAGAWLEITLSGGEVGRQDDTFSFWDFVGGFAVLGTPVALVPFVVFVLPTVFVVQRKFGGALSYFLIGGMAAGLLTHICTEMWLTHGMDANWRFLLGRPLSRIELFLVRSWFGGILPGIASVLCFSLFTGRVTSLVYRSGAQQTAAPDLRPSGLGGDSKV